MDKYINATKAIRVATDLHSKGEIADTSLRMLKTVLDHLPAENVEKVVYCKDCRKYGNPHLCPFGKRYMPLENGYCHEGERRKNE